MKADGQYIRRVVPSPTPLKILDSDAICTLMDAGHMVICCGGGGIPVIAQGDGYQGTEAVIDKDLTAAVLAQSINADHLLILTDADAVYENWGTPRRVRYDMSHQKSWRRLPRLTVQWARKRRR